MNTSSHACLLAFAVIASACGAKAVTPEGGTVRAVTDASTADLVAQDTVSPVGVDVTSTGPVDAVGVVTVDVPSSGPVDAVAVGPDEGSPAGSLFAQCSLDTQCRTLGAGGRCFAFFPGGLCTKTCTNDVACGTTGHCVSFGGGSNYCLPLCTSGDGVCNQYGSGCTTASQFDTSMICFASCWPSDRASTAPPGYATCAPSTPCDVYSGLCGNMPSGAADNGAACAMDADCKGGACIQEAQLDPSTGAMVPTGFVGGFCMSFGYQVDRNAYAAGQPLPLGNCPTGSAPFPTAANMVGDLTNCWATCDAANPCRAGYACTPLAFDDGGATTNGFCTPVDCAISDAGMDCPSGYTCHSSVGDGGAMVGVCGP